MKKITLLLMMLFVSFSGFAQFPLPYCGPITFTNNVEPITLVNFAGINNATLQTLNGTPAHEDFTAITGNVIAGSSYTITLKGNTDGTFTNRFMVFADWNQDGDFADVNEAYTITQTIYSSTGIDAVQATQAIDVPPTALVGTTRLRVKKIFGTTNYADPCLGTGYGQVEDYSLTVAPTPADLPDYVNLQWPVSANISAGGSVDVFGQVYEPGVTEAPGQGAGIQGWIGISPIGSNTNPNTWSTWVAATFNVQDVNNDEYKASIGTGLASGTYYYATRFQLNGGAYVYGGLNFGTWDGTTHPSGVLTVTPPANDECSGAVSLTVNADYLCGVVTPGTVLGATASSVDATACGGTEDDDVWYSFEATSTTHKISILNAAGSTTDMYHSLWTGSDCNSLSLVPGSCSDADNSFPSGLTIGQTYFLRVNTYTATGGQNTTFNVCVGTPPPPPANDDCSGSISLTVNPDYLCGVVTPGTVSGATASSVDATACGGTEDDDVWFSFEATSTSHKISILNAAGSTTDMYHSLWTGSDCNSLSLVPGSCSDADNSFPSGLTIGQTYFLRVNTYTATGGQTTTFNVCVGSPPPPPANDDCTGAVSLTVNSDYSCAVVSPGTVLGATASSVDASACGGTEDDDVWYSFEATSTTHKISILNAAGSTTDMYHSLWTGSDCNSLSLVPGSCSDADSSSPSGLTIGQTYFLRVNTYTATGGQTTTFNVCVGSPPPPPANDDCTGAVSLTVNPDYSCTAVTSGTVAGATASSVDATACGGTEDDDVWYSFEATAATHRISLTGVTGSTTDMYHSLWTGSDCGSLTLVPGSCSDADTSNPSGLTIGQTYFVRVNTYTATGGQDSSFNICIGTPPPPPVNDDCSGAITVACGSTTNGTTEGTTNEAVAVCGISGVTIQNTNGIWYKYVGDGSDVTVTTCSPTITSGDSRLAVFTGACGTLTCIGGNDDATAAGCATNTLASNVTFSTVIGTDYYILVYAYSSNALNFALTVNCTAACSPATANDECSTAMALTLGSTVTGADNLCSSASLDVTYPTCGNMFGTYYDTWYWFDSGSSTDFTISLANPTGTNGYAVYSGTCGALTMVPGSCTTTGANVALTGLTTGTTYYIRVFSTSTAARGSYDLTVSETLGTGSFDNGSFTYYPNPVKNVLNLSYNQAISNVEVFNFLGQKVSSNKFNANEAQVDMSHLSAGAYMVKVTSEGQVKTIKVIKQ